jgi:hypothetical protein
MPHETNKTSEDYKALLKKYQGLLEAKQNQLTALNTVSWMLQVLRDDPSHGEKMRKCLDDALSQEMHPLT